MNIASLLAQVPVAGWLLLALAVGPPDGVPDIEQLTKQLGSDQLTERRTAMKRLEAIGEPALKVLRKTASSDPDIDVRLRASVVIRAIEQIGFVPIRHFEGHTGQV